MIERRNFSQGEGSGSLLIATDRTFCPKDFLFSTVQPVVGRSSSILCECARPLEIEFDGVIGYFNAFDGNTYEPGDPPSSVEDFGPREFSFNFHSLGIYPLVNAKRSSGPVMTFSDSDFGFYQASSAAFHCLESKSINRAVLSILGLHSPLVKESENEYCLVMTTTSKNWLNDLLPKIGPQPLTLFNLKQVFELNA